MPFRAEKQSRRIIYKHPLRMIMKMKTSEEKIKAVLHDVVKDFDTTINNLKIEGFSEKILKAIDALKK